MAQVRELQVNGARVPVDVAAETPLLAVLRDTLGLTGSKIGCGEGACGRLHRAGRRPGDPRPASRRSAASPGSRS